MTLHITACDVLATHKCRLCVWHSGNDENVRDSNVIAQYEQTLENGEQFVRREPDAANEHPFWECTVVVSHTHKETSRTKVEWQRLDFAGIYNANCENLMTEVYAPLKSAWRRGLKEFRETKQKGKTK